LTLGILTDRKGVKEILASGGSYIALGELKNGVLSNAANLNEENQVASISRWLCNL